MTLNPSRNTLTLAQHTPRMLILSTSRAHNTPWQQHQNLQNIQNELHLFTEQSEINTDVILFHSLLRKPKAWCECSKLERNISQMKKSNPFFLFVIKQKQTIYIFQRLVTTFNRGAYSVGNHLKHTQLTKQNFVRIFKETIDWNHETIDCFGLTASQLIKTVFNLFKNI